MDFVFLRHMYVTYVGYATFAGVKTLLSVIARVFWAHGLWFSSARVCRSTYRDHLYLGIYFSNDFGTLLNNIILNAN